MIKKYIFILFLIFIFVMYSFNEKIHAEGDSCVTIFNGECILYAPTETQNNTTNVSPIPNTKPVDATNFKEIKPVASSNYQNHYNSTTTDNYKSTVPRPEWYEFAPIEYENPIKCKGFYISFSCTDRNYWYNRKENFESFLRDCDRRSGHYRDMCYSKLREREYNLNNNFVPASQQFAQNMERQRQIQMQEKMIDAITKPQQINVYGNVKHDVNMHGTMYHYNRW